MRGSLVQVNYNKEVNYELASFIYNMYKINVYV